MNDDELLARLAAAIDRTDPAPDRLREAAVRAMTWDTGIAELSLVAVGPESSAPDLRGEGVEDLSFGDDQRRIDLMIERDDDGTEVRVFGGVDPTGVELTALEPEGAGRPIEIDDAGRFEFEASSWGPFALVVKDADGSWRTPIIDLTGSAPETEDGIDIDER